MKNTFTTKNISGMAVFAALSFVVYLVEIPIFPGTPASFLQLDLSNVFVMLGGFMYGPIPAIIITVIKELIHIPVGSTGGVGELANVIITTSYVLLPSIAYKYKKGIKVFADDRYYHNKVVFRKTLNALKKLDSEMDGYV